MDTTQYFWTLAEHHENLKEFLDLFLDLCFKPESFEPQIIVDWHEELCDLSATIDNVLLLAIPSIKG